MTNTLANIDFYLAHIVSRPENKARTRRVLHFLDSHLPSWMEIARRDDFKKWLTIVNVKSQKQRGKILIDAWDFRDEKTLATLFQLFLDQQSGKRPHQFGAKIKGVTYRLGDLIFDEYEVIDLLGIGGFGEVFLTYSHNPNVQSFYALKLIKADRINEEIRKRFETEARLLLSLDESPFIVPARFIEVQGDEVALAMDYVAPDRYGRTNLAEHIRAGQVNIKNQIRWAIECCTGLEVAYKSGVKAHRDIKPANILIDDSHTARITDFGIASLGFLPGCARPSSLISVGGDVDSRRTMRGTSFGTPAYMAPEQFSDAYACDVKSDIYSLGVTLFELAQRELPFVPRLEGRIDGDIIFTTLARMHNQADLPRIDSPLYPVIEKCCSKRPENRFQSMAELQNALRQLAAKIGIHLPQTTDNEPSVFDRYNKLGNQAVAHARLGEHEKAIPLYREAMKIFDLGRAASDLGLSLQALGRYKEALEAYLSLKSDRTADDEISIGYCQVKVNGWQQAIPHYKAAMVLAPNSFNAWENLAFGYISTSQLDLAAIALARVVTFPESRANHWIDKAEVEFSLGRTNDAENSLNNALSLQSSASIEDRTKAFNMMGRLKQHIFYLAAKRLLGPGYNEVRLREALNAAIEVARSERSDEAKVIQTMRVKEPAITYSQAERIYRELLRP
jgi:serine/threonine protein kinase